MPVRHVLLGALAVLVFGGGVYLFLEVRASPAAPQPRTAAKTERARDTDEVAPPRKEPRAGESRNRTPGSVNRFTRKTASGTIVETPAPPTPTPPPPLDGTAAVKLDDLMAEANKAYDRMDFDEAKTIAHKVLRAQPANARMLRILVSSACIDHDAAEAQKQYNKLTQKSDRDAMRTRCQRDYAITLVEPPPKK